MAAADASAAAAAAVPATMLAWVACHNAPVAAPAPGVEGIKPDELAPLDMASAIASAGPNDSCCSASAIASAANSEKSGSGILRLLLLLLLLLLHAAGFNLVLHMLHPKWRRIKR
jgi:hypothetical protein